MTTIIVAGSRNFSDRQYLFEKLDEVTRDIDDTIVIVEGGCRGADYLGKCYARENGILYKEFKANWDLYGKRAGYLRNLDMARFALCHDKAILVAFPIGKSRGTRMMIDIAKKYNIEAYVFEEKDE